MSKRKLLLADDSITIQKVVNLTFADEGIEVISVGDGDEAMRKFTEAAPDLVMADVNMPGMDGYSICKMIKADETTREIPVILLVGSFEPFDEEKARHAGADDFLTKPFQSIRQLVHKVSTLLDQQNDESDSESENYEFSQAETAEELHSELHISDELGDAGMDDETIMTDQIGTIPSNEYQKFESGAETTRKFAGETYPSELQTNTDDYFSINSDLETQTPHIIEAETEPLSEDAFGEIIENSSLNLPEQKIYDFADDADSDFDVQTENDSDVKDLIKQSYSTISEPVASQDIQASAEVGMPPETFQENTDSIIAETREAYQDDLDSINEMIETHQDGISTETTNEIGKAHLENADAPHESPEITQETAGELFDFDDFNLLEIPKTPEEETSKDFSDSENETEQKLAKQETQIESFGTQPLNEIQQQNDQKIAIESEELSPDNRFTADYSESAEINNKSAVSEQSEETNTQSGEETSYMDSELLEKFSPQVIEAIAEKVFEKLSYRVLKEVADLVAPQMANLIVKKIKEENARE